MRPSVAWLFVALLAPACANPAFVLDEPGAAPAFDLSGDYRGTLEIEGEIHEAEMVLEQEESRLVGRLTTAIGLNAPLRGFIGGNEISLLFDYGDACEGEGRLLGEATPAGDRILGRIAVVDCTGRVEGGFTFVDLD